MATIAQSVPRSVSPLAWFGEFLKHELAPYPGRLALVARMVIAATLVMIICMTFRIPNAAWGAIYALTISREGPQATVRAARSIGGALVISAADVLIGALFFLDNPTLRFLWVIGTLFAVFYAISAMTNYAAAARFGYLVAVTIPLWDSHISGEAKVEGTLWGLWVMILASAITVLVELAFAELVPSDDVVRRIAERLACVEALLTSYATDGPVTEETKEKIASLSMLGTSMLRRTLQRSTYLRHYREQMGAVVGLVTRLVDIAANLTYFNIEFSDSDRKRIRNLVESI